MDIKISTEVKKKLLDIAEVIPEYTLLTGGHFIWRGDATEELNEGTVLSFGVAAALFARLKEVKVGLGLGVLVNDIGTTCDANACVLLSESADSALRLPKILQKSLHDHGLFTQDVTLFSEKHARNRGKKLFSRMLKTREDIQMDESAYWLKDSKNHQYLLTRRTKKDPRGTPACPLIMAGYAFEQQKFGYSTSVNFYYVDAENMENIPNHFMIEKGADVARLFGAKINVLNVYFTRERVFANFEL